MNKQRMVGDVLVEYVGELPNDCGHIIYCYEVHHAPSFSTGVHFTYMPIDDEPEEDGRISCDVDVHAGGDCVHPLDAVKCIAWAWEAHDEWGHGSGYRVTNG